MDTSIVVAFLADDSSVKARIATELVYLPVIALGELYEGTLKSQRTRQKLAQIEVFIADITVLKCDRDTPLEYGNIKHQLRLKGRPIPQNDIWIAATAKQHNFTLVTRDKHFSDVAGLDIQRW